MTSDGRINPRVPARDRLIVPPAGVLGDDKLDTMFAQHSVLAERAASANGQARMLEGARETAKESDDQAFADALRAGKPDPGQKASKLLEEYIGEARRMADALALTVRESRDEILVALDERRDQLAVRLDGRFEQDTERFLEAIRLLRPLVADRARVHAARTWLDDPNRSYRVPDPIVPTLIGPNGEVLLFSQVLAAMEATALPVAEATRDQRTWPEPEPAAA